MEKLFIRFKTPVAVVMLLILIGGAFSYKNLKTSLFPNVTFPKIKIIADNGEQPVDKMMIEVTKPLEDAIKKVEHLSLVRSATTLGSCEISAYMEWGSDIDLDKQQVESQIARIKSNLPPEIEITIEKMNPSILPVMGYSIFSDSKNQVELKLIAEYIVKPYISRIPGVASVQVIGGKVKEYRIIPDEDKLRMLKINPLDIPELLQQTDFIKSNGYTVDYNRLYLTVTDATLKNKMQIEDLVLFNNGVRTIKVSDIARVEISERSEYIKIKTEGRDVPLIAVLKQPESNLIDVADQVSLKVEELKKILPEDVSLKPYYNQAEFVNRSIRSIIDVLWIGLLLAILVVVIFLRSFKASGVILITVPMTLALTFAALAILGYDFNIMTIGGIAAAIGLIIDDAIIVVEQIHRTHEEYPDKPPRELVVKAIRFLFPAMVSSSLATIVILIPFELMTGIAGAYFKILTMTMIITLLCSFLVTWIGLPVVYLLFSFNRSHAVKPVSHKIKTHQWIRFFIARPYLSILLIIGLVSSIIFILPKLPTGFLPEMDEGSIVLDYTSPPGTSLEETDRILCEVDKIVESIPEVKTYSRRTGTEMGFFITEPYSGDYLIELNNSRNRTTEEVADDIRTKVESTVPALMVDFGQVITDMLGDLMKSVQPIEIKIFGDDHHQLEVLSQQVAANVETIDGVEDVFDGIIVSGPVLSIVPKEPMLKQFGLTASELQQQIEIWLGGMVVGSIPEKEQYTDIRLIYPLNNKTPVEKIKQISICTSTGEFFPLEKFARFSIESGVSEIQRENLQTMGAVTARLDNRDLGSAIREIKEKLAGIQLPPAYQIVYGGSYAEQQQSFAELLKILIISGLLVFLIVLFMFRNLKLSLIVIGISLLGISGGIAALFITGTPLNVGSYTGLIMIVGIIGENSIFTIQQFLTELKKSNVSEALIYAISARLRPKLMTATGAIVALSPLALGMGTGSQMHQPLAIAVIGGLIMALPLLLIVLPGMLKLAFKNESPTPGNTVQA
jgi:heavy metal efflux system protein